jgi:hypothetical protein
MSDPKDTAGPIIVWTDFGYEGWQPESFPSLRVAIIAGIPFNSVVTATVDVTATHDGPKHTIVPKEGEPQ